MGLVSQTVQQVASAITNTEYLRLSEVQKTEFEISRVNLSGKTAIIYANLPDIPITQNPLTISEDYPVEIWFLQLQKNPDDVDVDYILDNTKAVAYEFYKEFRKFANTSFNNWELTEGIALNATAAYQIGNEYLTGWQLTMTLSIENCLDPSY
jgi:hypothetical protein